MYSLKGQGKAKGIGQLGNLNGKQNDAITRRHEPGKKIVMSFRLQI